jgi:hypothetical protein
VQPALLEAPCICIRFRPRTKDRPRCVRTRKINDARLVLIFKVHHMPPHTLRRLHTAPQDRRTSHRYSSATFLLQLLSATRAAHRNRKPRAGQSDATAAAPLRDLSQLFLKTALQLPRLVSHPSEAQIDWRGDALACSRH